MKKLILLALAASLALPLSACGRKGDPNAPDGADPKYPRVYPKPDPRDPQHPTGPRYP